MLREHGSDSSRAVATVYSFHLVVVPACPLAAGTCYVRNDGGPPVWKSVGRGDVRKDLANSLKSGTLQTLSHHVVLMTMTSLKGHDALKGL